MESSEVRRRFLAYFQAHGHAIVQSSSLIPGNDPTLLFVNAGMVQFKDVFIGTEKRPYARATTAQKCMRVSGKHNDLDQVGPSPRHHTFFEMLGNFSFGDYFKRDAISFAWEFLTRELGLDANRLWPTVYIEDDEAYNLWQRLAHVPAERISRLGKKDNFWAMGDTGPCGPDSEIFWDRGPSFCTCGNPNCSPATGCDRFMEIWNLVFMQYEARADGTMVPLPRPSVDTGMGLERVTSVLQGVENNYDTDLFIPVMCRTQELLGHDDAARLANQTAYRVIADHSRALAFLIADGVLPGNEGRSYVLRMILRRAARFGRLLGFDEPFLAETAQTVINTMGHHYHELVERQDFIREVITREEKQFLNTLNQGLVRLDELAERLQADGETMIPGAEAFRLYDTYGFPFELTRDASQEKGFTVDEAGFRQAMLEQKERARSVRRRAMGDEAETYRLLKLPKTTFLGYEQFNTTSRIIAIIQDGKVVDQVGAGQSADIVLDATPFYAESGGQVGDTGVLRSEFGEAQVTDTVKPVPEVYVQRVLVETGALKTGETVDARVEIERRLDIARNHTATHLLHRALRQVIGEHAAQSGSLVLPDRLRFDFSHLQALSPAELAMVEDKVNAVIRDARPVTTQVLNYDDALKTGAVALFGEKYGAQVRVVSVEGYSKELCGGTHLRNSGQIGLFLILSESSVGSGLRRIEAVTGRGALGWVRSKTAELDELQRAMGVHPGEQVGHYNALLDELKDVKRQLADVQRSQAAANVESLMNKAITVKDANVLAVEVDVPDIDALRELADRFRDKLGSALVALGAVIDGKPFVVVAATPDLVSRGVHAGKIAGAAAQQMGGGGGGKPNMAQAGGKDSSRLAQALSVVARLAEEALS
ncbi:MAG: alanine--tRNA ligase [Chloroflexi bacterium]|nr:alanine--tRNA ligase [Chloroflexota bacterium]